MKCVAVDFDGVLHEYTGWQGVTPAGRPVEGAEEGLRALRAAGFAVVVHSARDEGPIWTWLQDHGLSKYVLRVTNRKPKDASAFFDDRGYHVPSNQAGGLSLAIRAFMESPHSKSHIEDGQQVRLP